MKYGVKGAGKRGRQTSVAVSTALGQISLRDKLVYGHRDEGSWDSPIAASKSSWLVESLLQLRDLFSEETVV